MNLLKCRIFFQEVVDFFVYFCVISRYVIIFVRCTGCLLIWGYLGFSLGFGSVRIGGVGGILGWSENFVLWLLSLLFMCLLVDSIVH